MISRGLALQAFARAKDEGEAWWWLGSLAVIKATAQDTGGLFSLVEITEPPGAAAPLHVHRREDEGFLLLDGEATFHVGEAVLPARAGDFVFGPRDIPHRYDVGPNGARMLFLLAPGGFEGLIREMGTPARSRTLPPADEPTPDMDTLVAIAKRYGNEILM